jgi:uncharacterized protein YfaS (alpha-2-macroglobulin family)
MAVVQTKKNQFGYVTTSLQTRLPLMAKISAPRFLTYGDTAKIPVVVINQDLQELTCAVCFRSNNLDVGEINAVEIVVPADSRHVVYFDVAATQTLGDATIQAVVSTARSKTDWKADAMQVVVPVVSAFLKEATGSF